MKKVLVGMLIGLGLVVGVLATGIAIGFTKEANEVSDEHVHCEEIGFVYEEKMPQYLPEYELECFEEMVFEMYLEECTNYCAECDLYYYDDCVCWNEECGSDCAECLEFDYMMYIEDNAERIEDLYWNIVYQIQDAYISETNEIEYCNF